MVYRHCKSTYPHNNNDLHAPFGRALSLHSPIASYARFIAIPLWWATASQLDNRFGSSRCPIVFLGCGYTPAQNLPIATGAKTSGILGRHSKSVVLCRPLLDLITFWAMYKSWPGPSTGDFSMGEVDCSHEVRLMCSEGDWWLPYPAAAKEYSQVLQYSNLPSFYYGLR